MIVYEGIASEIKLQSVVEGKITKAIQQMAQDCKMIPGIFAVELSGGHPGGMVQFSIDFIPEGMQWKQIISEITEYLKDIFKDDEPIYIVDSSVDIVALARESYKTLYAEMDSILDIGTFTEAHKERMREISLEMSYLKSEFMI